MSILFFGSPVKRSRRVKALRKSRWYYKFPGGVYGLGPTEQRFSCERQAREHIRRSWGYKRLPQGTQVWRAA